MSLRRSASILGAAAACGLALYGALLTAAPRQDHDDPWVLQFRSAGFQAFLRNTTTDVTTHIAVLDWRNVISPPPGSRLVRLEVDEVTVQIVELPDAASAKQLASTPHDRKSHVKCVGRFVCIIPPARRRPFDEKVEGEVASKMLQAFADRARRTP